MNQSKNDNELQQEKNHENMNFVQDSFFEKGNLVLKIRQILINLIFLSVLILPIMILFNSISEKKIWKNFYYWTYQDGFQLTDYLTSSISIGFLVILVFSLGFLFRNNYYELKLYPKKIMYNKEKLEQRKIILNDVYTERFGSQEFRESAKYYAVDGTQNLPDHMISDLFKAGGVDIK